MMKLLAGGAAAALVVAIAPAIAQPAPPPGVAQGTAPVSPPPPLPPMAPLPPPPPHMHMMMMMMSDRVMTRDEVASHVRDLFAHLDTNRDGYLTREEIDATHQAMMGGMHGNMEQRLAERGKMFDKLDANHDGSISRQEFMAAEPQMQERRMIIMRDGPAGSPGGPGMEGVGDMHMHGMGMHGMGFGGRLFDMADRNHDGRVSLAEAEAAALEHFDRADLNHDGKITPEERGQAHRLMRGEHRPS